jgi:hypothetical protein
VLLSGAAPAVVAAATAAAAAAASATTAAGLVARALLLRVRRARRRPFAPAPAVLGRRAKVAVLSRARAARAPRLVLAVAASVAAGCSALVR